MGTVRGVAGMITIYYTQNDTHYKMAIAHALAVELQQYQPAPNDHLLVTLDKDGLYAGGGYLVKAEQAIAVCGTVKLVGNTVTHLGYPDRTFKDIAKAVECFNHKVRYILK
jgi:hypothetical protein